MRSWKSEPCPKLFSQAVGIPGKHGQKTIMVDDNEGKMKSSSVGYETWTIIDEAFVGQRSDG